MPLSGANPAIGQALTQQTGASGGGSSGTGFADDFQTFLTLLTTQLQQQDPMEPMKTKEFTQQLVSFSQVEQAIKQNQKLEDVAAAVSADNFSGMVGFLGKDVTMDTNKAQLSGGKASWTYDLGATADDVQLRIKNSNGTVVREMDGPTEQGQHSVTWDGTDNIGNPLPEGPYSLDVAAKTAGGQSIEAKVTVQGRVEGVESDAGTHKLRVNGRAVPLDTLLKVSEPATENTGAS